MKKLLALILTFALITIFPGIINAQVEQNQVNIKDIEKIIEQKIKENSDEGEELTKEELTEIILKLKDEKIKNLEGNISTLIGSAATFVGIIALVLTIISLLIGWGVNYFIGEKLKRIEEIKTSINDIKQNIETKVKEAESYYEEIKDFKYNIKNIKKDIDSYSTSVNEMNKRFDDTMKYIGGMEDIINSTALVLKFIKNKKYAQNLISETKDILDEPQPNPDFVIIRLKRKLGVKEEINDVEDVKKYLDEEVRWLKETENDIWELVTLLKSVEKHYADNHDDSYTLYDEFQNEYEGWKSILDRIEVIRDVFSANLEMNNTQNDDK